MNGRRRAGEDGLVPDLGLTWRVAGCAGITWLRAHFERQRFPRHTHDVYVVGVNEAGAHATWHHGAHHLVPAGRLAVVCPGDVHTGESVTGLPWHYRAIYVAPALMLAALQEERGSELRFPLLLDDPALVRDFLAMHRAAEHRSTELRTSSEAIDWLARFARRFARVHKHGAKPVDSDVVRRAITYINDHLCEDVALDDIARSAGVNRYHLIRQFRRARGLTPYGYLIQARVIRAQQWLAAGLAPAQVAAKTGFADQSHLTRAFHRLTGTTPARYARSIRR